MDEIEQYKIDGFIAEVEKFTDGSEIILFAETDDNIRICLNIVLDPTEDINKFVEIQIREIIEKLKEVQAIYYDRNNT